MTSLQKFAGFGALASVIVLNSSANVLLKIGAGKNNSRLYFDIATWHTFAGIACFAMAVVIYAWSLKHFPLHIAQSIVAVQYILTMILAANLLGEAISPSRWIGIGLITVGLYFCVR